jgi:hypothetical protein
MYNKVQTGMIIYTRGDNTHRVGEIIDKQNILGWTNSAMVANLDKIPPIHI